jgi:hypothetical protein
VEEFMTTIQNDAILRAAGYTQTDLLLIYQNTFGKVYEDIINGGDLVFEIKIDVFNDLRVWRQPSNSSDWFCFKHSQRKWEKVYSIQVINGVSHLRDEVHKMSIDRAQVRKDFGEGIASDTVILTRETKGSTIVETRAKHQGHTITRNTAGGAVFYVCKECCMEVEGSD